MKAKRQKNPIVILLVIAAAFAIALAWKYHSVNNLRANPPSAVEQDNQILQSQQQYQQSLKVAAINGEMVSPAQVQRPFVVVIENFLDSRPQSGLSQADIVYEALAEGGITRFLAVFQSQNAASIGPVRSARTYFNDWAQELGAIYAHVGGNSDALYYIKKGIPGVSDADQFFNDPYFKRISSRPLPLNTYTSSDKLLALSQQHGFGMQKNYSD